MRDRRGEGWMLEHLGRISHAPGDFARAESQLEAARRIAAEVADQELLSSCRLEITQRQKERANALPWSFLLLALP